MLLFLTRLLQSARGSNRQARLVTGREIIRFGSKSGNLGKGKTVPQGLEGEDSYAAGF